MLKRYSFLCESKLQGCHAAEHPRPQCRDATATGALRGREMPLIGNDIVYNSVHELAEHHGSGPDHFATPQILFLLRKHDIVSHA